MSLTPRIDGFESNIIINGAMDFFQRSTSSVNLTASFAYRNVDRFRTRFTGTVTGTPTSILSSDVPTNSLAYNSLSMSIQRNASAATLEVSQRVESVFARSVAGSVCSVSFKIKSPIANQMRLRILTPSATDNWTSSTEIISITQNITPSSAWQEVSFENLSLPFSVKSGMEVEVSLLLPSGTDGSAQAHLITEICLVKKPAASDFVLAAKSFLEELALCQRYYEVGMMASSATASSTFSRWWSSYKTQKRVTPVVDYTIITGQNSSAPSTIDVNNQFGAAGRSNGASINDWTAWTFRADAEL